MLLREDDAAKLSLNRVDIDRWTSVDGLSCETDLC